MVRQGKLIIIYILYNFYNMKTSSTTNTANKIDELKNKPENRKCFDCHEKVIYLFLVISIQYKYIFCQGTTYAVLDFGVFVCSTCAGIHRELTHKVKGIAMSIFNEKDIEVLTKNGNEVITCS